MYGKLFTPPNASLNALVIVIHGIGEHCGCYDDLAEKFAVRSVGLFAFDLQGHGRSPGRRGHTSIKTIKDDLRFVIEIMRQRFPDLPVVLFGHSLGGHIALSYAIDGNDKVQGVIASSPWLKMINPPSSLLIGLAKWVSPVLPWITVQTGIKAGQLAQGGVGVKSSKTDPLLHKKISIKLFTDLWANSKTILCNPHRIRIPLLLMHGTADPLTSCDASESFAQNAGEYATFKQWNDMRHNLLNDTGSEEVFQYIMKWLSKLIK
jgi:alpha-beta hydrolase superfamily lysophospholipase